MTQATPPLSHWNKHAQQWGYVKAPLRPCAEDLTLIQQALSRHFPDSTPLEALLLGVTPELATNAWSPTLNLLAIDGTQAMIRSLWRGNDAHRSVVCGNWLQLPVRDACMDVALIDGGLPAISFPESHRKVAAQLQRVLKPNGLFIARIFARPDRAETVETVFEALRERRIGNFHVYKWRLAMAMQGEDTSRGVRVDDVWRTHNSQFGRHDRLEQLTGWPIEEISTIDAYRGSRATYHFPSVAEMIGALGHAFDFAEIRRGSYELAERCPTMIFRRIGTP